MFTRVLDGSFARAQAAALIVALAAPAAASAAAPPPAQITFDGLAWANARNNVRSRLASDGFSLIASTPDDFFRGTVDGNPATVTCVFTPDDELVYVRVIFDGNAGVAGIDAALGQAYGKPAYCNAQNTQCRWERGDSEVTSNAAGDPYAPDDQASLEYTAGGDLAAKYVVETQRTDRDQDRGTRF
jgi:hypothetical protein